MKMQNLAIIFIIIILPISIVFSSYTKNHIKTLELQSSYDTKLTSATYDALKSYQLNASNSDTSDLANSKMRDIEASVNSFFKSISNNFNMSGYNSEILKEYVPALVYTMYDGYYIYSPYINTLDQETATRLDPDVSTFPINEKISGLHPYIYYSCRYKKDGFFDVVITYTLDNCITINGIVKESGVDTAVYVQGNLVNGVNKTGSEYKINGTSKVIEDENLQKEYIEENVSNKKYPYIKINGVKYYKETNGVNPSKWFSVLNGKRYYTNDYGTLNTNTSAKDYYEEASNLKDSIINGDLRSLSSLNSSDAVDDDGQYLKYKVDSKGEKLYDFGNYQIFEFDDNGVNIEEPNSNFNQHRLAVIRYCIEKNLSISIANYNHYTDSEKTNFQMPKLKEDEWEKILHNVSMISFMQGLSIGGKVYNGYSIVSNTENEEVVTEDSIYIVTVDKKYHRTTCEELTNTDYIDGAFGVSKMSFEIKQYENKDEQGEMLYYTPRDETACRKCIISSNSNEEYDGNIYKYLTNKQELAQIYYTALAREKYSMYRVSRNIEEIIKKYNIN